MLVYHGTTLEIQKPAIVKGEVGRDFGFAFYTTDLKAQAEKWALRRARLLSRKSDSPVLAVVNVYEWNACDNSDMDVKEFDGVSYEWLDMVVKCRSDTTYRHPHDVVIGKIADDNVGETVDYVLRGIMRREDAIERLRFEEINNQIAFCTEKSLSHLRFIKSYQAEE